MAFSSRDIHLLDGRFFFTDGWAYRKLFALDFIKGLKTPPLGVVLATHARWSMLEDLRMLLTELETWQDLISHDYSYSFEKEQGRRSGGAQGGFRVQGGFGNIDVRPAGYCDLTVMDSGPIGRGRIVEIIDMRVRREYPTLDKGILRVHSRHASVGWFDELRKLVAFLQTQDADSVEILHELAEDR
jgi:hypothetical protein